VPDSPPTARFTTPDGSDIAVHDLGGDGEPLLLAHATGFHAMVLLELARHLPQFHCYALDFRAHGSSRAASGWDGGWEGFASDVLTVLGGLGIEHAYGFGHSLGGASILLAEEAVPGTFRHLYCFEPIVAPILHPLAPSFDNPLSTTTAWRRERFASKREALENYASKPPLSILHPAVLASYVEYGFETEGDGQVRLLCSPADEARVYANSLSHAGFRNLVKVRCPVDLACGALTDGFGEDVLAALSQRLRESGGTARTTVFAELGHFGPMEDPEIIAASMTAAFSSPPMPGSRL
jgi:pimeloyl-ACP methyl ester carboxylesterase